MISLSSNCCRVDAVKASANQLKLRLAQQSANTPDDQSARAANQQLQAVELQIKSGDATKAELALSAAKSAVEHLPYRRMTEFPRAHTAPTQMYGSLSIRV